MLTHASSVTNLYKPSQSSRSVLQEANRVPANVETSLTVLHLLKPSEACVTRGVPAIIKGASPLHF